MLNLFLFLGVVLIWGTTFLGIALEIGPVPVIVSVFYRFALAGPLLVLALAAMGRLRAPARTHQPYLVAQALCLFSLNFLCLYNAAAFVPSGVVSVVFSLASVCNAVNARIFFGDRIGARTLLAAAMGACGLLCLFGRDVFVEFNLRTLEGAGLAALGTLFFSLGNMVSRRNSAAGITPALANAWAMSYGALFLLAVIALTRTPLVAPPDARYLGALVYLAIFGSVVGFTAYLMLVARVGSSRAAYSTVLFPVVALALSAIFENYRWSALGVLGLALCLAGNVVVFAPADWLARLRLNPRQPA